LKREAPVAESAPPATARDFLRSPQASVPQGLVAHALALPPFARHSFVHQTPKQKKRPATKADPAKAPRDGLHSADDSVKEV